MLTESQRSNILTGTVAEWARRGWATESLSSTQAVLVKHRRIGWFWNTVLTLLTAGLWLIVVVYRVVNRKSDRAVLFVDEAGRVHER